MDRPPESLGWASRAIRLYRAGSAVAAVIALLVANAIPIVGVAFLGWSLWTILVLYWLENGIVGLWNVPRMLLARGPETVALAASTPVLGTGCQRLLLIPFFAVHYGIFWLGHGLFLMLLPGFALFGGAFDQSTFPVAPIGSGFPPDGVFGGPIQGNGFGTVDTRAVVFGGLAMFVSHGVSFFQNYIGRGEYLQTTAGKQMIAVYGRVVVLHLTILLGAFAIAALGAPIWVLVILVIGKTVLDLGLHAREHSSPPTQRLP
jgi:hypothetical protein